MRKVTSLPVPRVASVPGSVFRGESLGPRLVLTPVLPAFSCCKQRKAGRERPGVCLLLYFLVCLFLLMRWSPLLTSGHLQGEGGEEETAGTGPAHPTRVSPAAARLCLNDRVRVCRRYWFPRPCGGAVSHSQSLGCRVSFPDPGGPYFIPRPWGAVSHSQSLGCHVSFPDPGVPCLIPSPWGAVSHSQTLGGRISFPVPGGSCLIPRPWGVVSHSQTLGGRVSFPDHGVPCLIPSPWGAVSHSQTMGCRVSFPVPGGPCLIPRPWGAVSHSQTLGAVSHSQTLGAVSHSQSLGGVSLRTVVRWNLGVV